MEKEIGKGKDNKAIKVKNKEKNKEIKINKWDYLKMTIDYVISIETFLVYSFISFDRFFVCLF